MPKQKRKLTSSEKAAQARRRAEFMTIFINGKQKRVPRPATIDGMSVEDFIRRNADPVWLHQNEMWEYIDQASSELDAERTCSPSDDAAVEDDIPF